LREPDILPSEEVLEKNIGKDVFRIYQELIVEISKMGLNTEWNYYKDGKSWLCKVTYKKKTVFWLSIWDGYFKTSFFFTAKNCFAIEDLDIDNRIKKEFTQTKAIGKLLPLILDIREKDQLIDLLKIAECKKKLK
jgi:hypothetical protein